METIYVIHFDDVDSFETLGHEMEAFRNYKDAKARFDDIVSDAKSLFLENEWEENESIDFYETWPECAWGESHYGIYLERVGLK